MNKDEIVRLIKKVIEAEDRQLTQSDIPQRIIKRRHVEDNVIVFGLAANLPATGNDVKAYYATDTDVLYLWDGSTFQSH
jgi:hypothetical protein